MFYVCKGKQCLATVDKMFIKECGPEAFLGGKGLSLHVKSDLIWQNRERQGGATSARAKVNVPEEDAYGHVQPQALEFEEAVLGALMIEQDAYSQVSEILRPESFYDHRHQLIKTLPCLQPGSSTAVQPRTSPAPLSGWWFLLAHQSLKIRLPRIGRNTGESIRSSAFQSYAQLT